MMEIKQLRELNIKFRQLVGLYANELARADKYKLALQKIASICEARNIDDVRIIAMKAQEA